MTHVYLHSQLDPLNDLSEEPSAAVESRRAARMSMQNRLQNWIRNRRFQLKLLNIIKEGKARPMGLMY